MKRIQTFFIVLIILMTAATVWLIYYQVQAIKENYEIARKTFASNVQSAIQNVIDDVEKVVVISDLKTKITTISNDTINLTDKLIMTFLKKYNDSLKSNSYLYFVDKDSNIIYNKNCDFKLSPGKKTIFVLDLIAQLTQKKITIEPDFSPNVLKNKLKEEFKKFGITDSFEFAILDTNNNPVYKTKNYTLTPKKSTEYFQSSLFEYDFINMHGYKLSLFFDRRNSKNIYSLYTKFVLPSVALTFLIILIFIISVWIYFRQLSLAKIKDQFLKNMTHELKTPIATIKLSAEMLKDETLVLNQEIIKNLGQTIFTEAGRLLSLVEKILLISMLEKGRVLIRRENQHAHKLIEESVDSFKLIFDKIKVDLTVNLDAKEDLIYVDKMHFVNIINNLIDNAIKYRKRNKQLILSIKTYNENDYFVFEIKDNGIGIPKDKQKHIFKEFYRVDSSGNIHNIKGYGLGLSYVKRILDEFGAKIQVISEEGIGTTFIIKIPLATENQEK